MIKLTRLDGSNFILNCDMIETVEAKPDTTIRLNNKNIYIVKETVEDVISDIVQYKSSWFTGFPRRDDA